MRSQKTLEDTYATQGNQLVGALTLSGRLSVSFKDSDASEKIIGALAWSPNGKYLAESASDIHILDVAEQKLVVTFGRVDKAHWIATLAWSPQSSMLASSTNLILGDYSQNIVNVWKLS